MHNQTMVEPLVLTSTLALGALLLALPRRHAVVPFVLLACFLPVAQRVVIAELDFNMLRVLLVFGFARLLLRGDFRGLELGRLDFVFFGWVFAASVIYTLQRGTLNDAIFRAGMSYDILGLFVVFRCWVRDLPSLRVAIVASAWSAMAVATLMSIEFTTGRNFFSVFGGVPEITVVRDGRLRCQAAFPHPIMAGSVGAVLAPLCLWLAVQRGRHRLVGGLGWFSSTLIVALSSSSGPLLGWLAGMGACGLWTLRHSIHLIRWGVVAAVVVLHIIANRPVWYWIGQLNVIGASTSYHRARLIDAAIERLPEWALLGVESTVHWGAGLGDVTNQYILEGVRGGIWSLVALLLLLFFGFRYIGAALTTLRRARRSVFRARRNAELLCWALGATLFVHVVNFVGVSYFGQIQVFLVLTLAMIAGARSGAKDLARASERRPLPDRSDRVRALLGPTGPSVSTS
jgi:hypothetical protein